MHGARLLGGTEIDAQISRAARVNGMGGSGAGQRARIAGDSAATGSTRGND